ncbi:MAG: hypothetical protein FWE95_05205, partial [Planctomycetaceae bacterium]|nr:hypothetical protein [Planctomycetaceae bacterium]
MKISLPRFVVFVAATVAVCFSVSSVASAQQNLIFPGTPTTPLGDPQAHFNDSNLPSMPNSLFPGTASGNTVTVIIVNAADNIRGHVYGGIGMGTKPVGTGSYGQEDSNNNRVIVHSGQIGTSTTGGNVTGGWSLIGNVVNNEV